MGLGWTGAYGAAGGSAAVQAIRDELLKRALLEQQQQQQQFQNDRALKGDARADAGLDLQRQGLEAQREQQGYLRQRQESQDAAMNQDREVRRALETREMLPPETFLPEDDPAVPAFGKAGLAGTLRMVPPTVPMGADFQGPMPDGETPEQAQVGRIAGRLTMPTSDQAKAAEDDRRQREALIAQQQAQARMDRQAEEQSRHNRVMEAKPTGQGQPLEAELKEFEAKEQIKAKYGGSRPSLGSERQTLAYYNRAKQASDDIAALEPQVQQMGLAGQTRMELAPNFLQSQMGQTYRQAQRAFTEARLRKESGAAIPAGEYENDARTYFAQPGDTPQTLEQKRRARQVVLDGLKFSSGNAYEEFYGSQAPRSGVTIKSITQVP